MTERKPSGRIVPPVETGVVIVPEEGLVRAYMINKDIQHVLKENIAQRTIDRVNDYDQFLNKYFTNKDPQRIKHPKAAYSSNRNQLDDEVHEVNLQLADGGVRHIRYVTTFKNGNTIVARFVRISDVNSMFKNNIWINFLDSHISMQHNGSHVSLAEGQPHTDPLTYKKKDPNSYPDILDHFKKELGQLKAAIS